MNILFVCTGNTCRSPMAAALLKEKYPSEKVKSAGVFASFGASASRNSSNVLRELGIELDHESSPVTIEQLQWADLVLTMTTQHKQALMEEFPHFIDKYFTLKEYNSLDQANLNLDISDPFGGDESVYRDTRDEIEAQIAYLLKRID